MSNLTKHQQAPVEYQYNAGDIQPRVSQDAAQMALVNHLADALAQRLNQSAPEPQQQRPQVHYHIHQGHAGNGAMEALVGLMVVSFVLLGLFALCGAIYQSSRAELPTVEDVA